MTAEERDLISHVERRLARIEEVIVPLARMAIRADSREVQAKKAGVSRQTLWRREKREKMRLLADRTFK